MTDDRVGRAILLASASTTHHPSILHTHTHLVLHQTPSSRISCLSHNIATPTLSPTLYANSIGHRHYTLRSKARISPFTSRLLHRLLSIRSSACTVLSKCSFIVINAARDVAPRQEFAPPPHDQDSVCFVDDRFRICKTPIRLDYVSQICLPRDQRCLWCVGPP